MITLRKTWERLALVAGDARELGIEVGLDLDTVVRGVERDQPEDALDKGRDIDQLDLGH